MKINSCLHDLTPTIVWQHFANLCAIPRPSLHEEALKSHLMLWAQARGIDSRVDAVGNLILSKPASPGYQAAAGVVLQGHLDMVCQANRDTEFDFHQQAIECEVRDGWVIAPRTTLGADNGIGVALALAALEQTDLIHPPLEVLLTVNEECGMDGALGLAAGTLNGSTLINMDSEEWGHFYLGCAGGVDVHAETNVELLPAPDDRQAWSLTLCGGSGGHSGIDIHLGRANAIKLLAEFVLSLDSAALVSLSGGSARNAIPREAQATLWLPRGFDLATHVAQQQAIWQQEFTLTDPKLNFSCSQINQLGQIVSRETQQQWLTFLAQSPNGVTQFSQDFAGVTDTSCNLGVVNISYGCCSAIFKVRSLHDTRADELANQVVTLAQQHQLSAYKNGAYPGWTPNPKSALLALCQQIYQQQFGEPAGLQVIHAGLECGIISASHPQLDMISFGPNIRGAHAPGERVEITTVEQCWILLQAILRGLAEAGK